MNFIRIQNTPVATVHGDQREPDEFLIPIARIVRVEKKSFHNMVTDKVEEYTVIILDNGDEQCCDYTLAEMHEKLWITGGGE